MKDDFSLKGDVITALESIDDPAEGKNLIDAHMIEEVDVDDGVASIVVLVPLGRSREDRASLEESLREKVGELEGIKELNLRLTTPKAVVSDDDDVDPLPEPTKPKPASQATGGQSKAAAIPQAEPVQGVGKVIAVASGKGGVGKSTVAVNLALGLRDLGYRVGVLDIDIYGPSLPTLLGLMSRPAVADRRIVPLTAHGLRIMSLGFLMEDDTPVIWRGPIVTGIIRQFLRDVDWSGLDYLVVDMPPGTGDAQLALAQTVPVDGAVVVTTPSKLALIDAARGLEMFRTLNIDVLGIVENMSKFVSPTGEEFHIFGEGGVSEEAERLSTKVLASIPLDPAVRQGGDEGAPVVVSAPESQAAQSFLELAESVTALRPIQPGDSDSGGKKKGLFSFLKG